MSLQEYALESVVRQTESTMVHRGRRLADGLRVVLKLPRAAYPTAEQLDALVREHALLVRAAPTGVMVEVIALERTTNTVALVLEDLGDRTLGTLIREASTDLVERVAIAARVADALGRLHDAGIVHRDVNPEHVRLLDGDVVKLLDLHIASIDDPENRTSAADRMEGTVAYMSPEQTGRVGCPVDRRSDLYSLGVTLFELFAGRRPFTSDQLLELVHCHVARVPASLDEIDPRIPRPLARIVARLLAKSPDDRYQSAASLRADLERCLAGLRAGDLADFELGTLDRRGDLRAPANHHGRERERAVLRSAAERLVRGEAELVVVRGPSGIGKSALLAELSRNAHDGLVVASGAFEPAERAVPYGPIAAACRDLVRRELAKDGKRLDRFARRLREALGPNGGLVQELVPEIVAAIGVQPKVVPLGPAEARRRFDETFLRFVEALTHGDEAVALVLDDVQWIDPASLRLLRLFATSPTRGSVLIVASIRDGEGVTAAHVRWARVTLRGPGMRVTEIALQPLDEAAVGALAADAMGCAPEDVAPLAALLHGKANGNPFLTRRLLVDLAHGGALRRRPSGEWSWDVDAVQRATTARDVAELVEGELARLPAAVRRVAAIAACIGIELDVASLVETTDEGEDAIHAALATLTAAGLVAPLDDGRDGVYRFVHDRVHQVAHESAEPALRSAAHLRAGRRLLARCDGNPVGDEIFAIVDHLEAGVPSVKGADGLREIARLALAAATRARDAAAHARAYPLAETAITLLGVDAWTTEPEAAARAHLLLSECAFVLGRHDEALEVLDIAATHGRTPLERFQALAPITEIHTSQNRMPEAIEAGLAAAALLGVTVDREPSALAAATEAELGATLAAIGGRRPAELVDLPEMSDPEKLALVELVFKLIPATFQTDQRLFGWLILKAIRTMVESGNAPVAPHLWVSFGLAYGAATGDSQTARELGELGVALARRRPGVARAAALFVFAFLFARTRTTLAGCVDLLREAQRAGLESGDRIHASFAIAHEVTLRLLGGEGLASIEKLAATARARLAGWSEESGGAPIGVLDAIDAHVAALQGRPQIRSQGELVAAMGANLSAVGFVHHVDALKRMWLGDMAGAGAVAEEAAAGLALYMRGTYLETEHTFVRAVALASALPTLADPARDDALAALEAHARTFRGWVADGLANGPHRLELIEAELAGAHGRADEAMERFDRAIAQAHDEGCVHHAALAAESCARFHLRRGRATVARAYLADALQWLRRWGATGAAAKLAERFPTFDLGDEARDPRDTVERTTTVTHTSVSANLDVMTAIRAAQAIARELVPERLLGRLMHTVVENAGARRGVLVIANDGALSVEAWVAVDPDEERVGLAEDLETSNRAPRELVRYVTRTNELVLVGAGTATTRFATDPYFARGVPRSALCLPLLHQGRCTGAIYLENDVAAGVFDPGRVELLQVLAAQAAVALENARLFAETRAKTDLLREANARLEDRVRARTEELAARNGDMRLVLDHVAQAIFMVDRTGRLSPERSATADAWFGGFEGRPMFAEHLARVAPAFAGTFAVTFETCSDGIVPLALAIDQLPRGFAAKGRHYECSYDPLGDDGFDGLLVVIRDVTDAVQRQTEQAEHGEELAVVHGFVRDRRGLLSFLAEAAQIVDELQHGEIDATAEKRLLHTLKGSASMMGLSVVAALAHGAEDELAESGDVSSASYQRIAARFRAIGEVVAQLRGERGEVALEVTVEDLVQLADDVRSGAEADHLLARIESLREERVSRPLDRLGRYAQALGERLGKGEIELVVDAPSHLRLGARWASLWSVLVHVVRNAVDHGIDPPDERAARGKPATPRLRLSASVEAGRLFVRVEDDGRGIDWARVAERAAQRGLPSSTREALVRALLAPDFSTRDEVTTTSGRGAGLAAVDEEVRDLGGSIQVDSVDGAGCTWTFDFPAPEGARDLCEPRSRRLKVVRPARKRRRSG